MNVDFGEEECDFNSSGFGGVGAVDGVSINAVGEIGADRAFVSFLRVGCAHQVAVFLDGVLTLEHLNKHGTGDHEVNQILLISQ